MLKIGKRAPSAPQAKKKKMESGARASVRRRRWFESPWIWAAHAENPTRKRDFLAPQARIFLNPVRLHPCVAGDFCESPWTRAVGYQGGCQQPQSMISIGPRTWDLDPSEPSGLGVSLKDYI